MDVRNLKDQAIQLLDLPMLRARMSDGSTIVGHVFSRTIRTSHGLYYDEPKDGDSIPPREDRELFFVCYTTKETSPSAQPVRFAFATEHEEKVIH